MIQTAEEFLLKNKIINTNDTFPIELSRDCHIHTKNEFIRCMIEFAKLHVQEALKEASEKAEAYTIDEAGQTIYTDAKIDKESILNAYNLDNIK